MAALRMLSARRQEPSLTMREKEVPVVGPVRLADLLHLANEAPDRQVIVEHLKVVVLLDRLRSAVRRR